VEGQTATNKREKLQREMPERRGNGDFFAKGSRGKKWEVEATILRRPGGGDKENDLFGPIDWQPV